MKKRSLSLLLALIMVLSLMLPGAAAFADTTDTKTPVSTEATELKWAYSFGSSWTAAPSVPLLADGGVYVMSDRDILKLSRTDGSTIARGSMLTNSSYGYTPCVEAGDKIVAPLGTATLQAFDSKTLMSEWTYQNFLGGQSLSRVLYSDGKLYVGFWNGETKDADFACVDAETGRQCWSYTVKGGFYWAGAAAYGDYIIVGTDDGENGSKGNSSLLCFKKNYGKDETVAPVSSAVLTGCGDVRSSIVMDGGKAYFTTKGGFLCSADINKETGAISGVKTVSFGAQSTSTPVIYGNYVYFGAGSGISDSGSKGNFVIADKSTLNVKGYVALKGYPQCEMLLSTAYLESTGYLYFYSTYNMTPGGISLIKVKADDVSKTELVEIYDAEDCEGYCIASIVADENGNLYYKNDSGCIICVGPVRVTKNVYVSISDKGSAQLAYEKLKVSDRNGDGKVDIDEVLYAAHEKSYNGGAQGGYATEDGQYGRFITKLWGDTSGNFGYYVNNAMAMSLGDEVNDGDHVYAYVTANAYPNSDAYAFFDKSAATVAQLGKLTLSLKYQSGYDESWAPVFGSFENATVKVYDAILESEADGVDCTSLGGGKYSFSFKNDGEYVIVATAENNAIVPAVCRVSVSERSGFKDVQPDAYYYEAVEWGNANGIVYGYSDSVFAPDDSCTRGQIVSFLYRHAGCPEVDSELDFDDVDYDSYYYDAIIWAAENGIAYGYGDGSFGPNDTCTRAQTVSFLCRYLGGKAQNHNNSFKDVDSAAYYYEAIMWAVENGIAYGYGNGTFGPDDTCTRAQIVSFIYRAVEK